MKLFSYSSCSTCRRAIKWLKNNDIAFELIDLLKSPPSKEMLISASELYGDRKYLLNTSGVMYRSIGSDVIKKMTDKELFEKLCNLLNLSELNSDPKFSDNSSRAKNMDELKNILEKKLSTKKTNEWVKDMEKEKIPCGPIFNIKEAVENPQIDSRNMIVKAYHKVIGDFKLAGNPIKMSAYKDEKTRGDIPDLDEHRQKILEEFN